jgi:hypothetical protein
MHAWLLNNKPLRLTAGRTCACKVMGFIVWDDIGATLGVTTENTHNTWTSPAQPSYTSYPFAHSLLHLDKYIAATKHVLSAILISVVLTPFSLSHRLLLLT